ncbi:MAG: TonB-dependent receptor [Bacteroidales bacterium]|nr:TonB-dependent receptor [Bacteroidales bacterium]
MSKRLISLLLLCVSATSLVVAQSFRVFGTLKDDTGAPIEFASVRILGTAQMTVSNLKGNYSLHFGQQDTVTVVYSMIGYETRKRKLIAPFADSIRLDVVLPSLMRSFNTATVVGQRIQTGTTQKLDFSDAALAPSSTGNTVEEMIATQAGVSTHNELSSQYNVRGGSYDENVVYLNGLEVYRPMLVRSGEQEGLSIINGNMVEGVAFSTGGFEARYGDKMSSVLDITYKRPETFEGSVYASLLGAGAYVGLGNKHLSFMTSARYKTTAHLLGTTDTKGEYNPKFFDYQAYLSWRPNRRWTIDIFGNISDNHYQFTPEDRETRFGTMFDAKSFKVYFDGQEKDRFQTLFGAATITRHFNPETFLAVQASTYSTKERETYDIQGQYWLQEATTQEQLGVGTYLEHARNRLRANVVNLGLRFRTKLTGHTLQAGINWQRENIKENAREWEMRDSMGYSLPYEPQNLRLIYSLAAQTEITSNRLSAFLQDTWRIKSGMGLWNLTYGLRFSRWDWNKENLISPRLSVGFLPASNEHLTLRFATGFYYQSPFYKELRDTTLRNGVATVALNKEIRSQRSIHFVLGGDYTFQMMNRPFKFTTELYYKALSNLNPYSVNNVRIVYYGRNVAKGHVAGIDFKLFGEFVPGNDSWITFSLMSSKETIDGISVPRPTDQRYNLSLFFTDYFPGSTRWRMTLKAALAGGLPFGPPHSQRTEQIYRAPAYKRVDLGASYRLFNNSDRHVKTGFGRFIKNVWLGVDVFNLLGIANVNSYYWITDITNTQYAVPNYLTGRQLNARLTIDF